MPNPPRISSIEASRFRGATTESSIGIDVDRPFVLIHGENGSGKSSLVDAIDIVTNGNASLATISGASIKDHLTSLGADSDDLYAAITIDETTWKAEFSGSKILVKPNDVLPEVRVLRRDKILNLVTAAPADRFKQLKHFIDVDNVQKSEGKLKKACKDIKDGIDVTMRELAAQEQTLKRNFEENKTEDEANLSWEEWAKQRSSTEAQSIQENLDSIIEALGTDQNCRFLLESKNTKQIELNDAREARDKALDALNNGSTAEVPNARELISLLENSREFFSGLESLEECPVCKKPNDLPSIVGEVEKSLREYSSLVELTNVVNAAQEKVRELERAVYGLYVQLARACRSLLRSFQKLSAIIEFEGNYQDSSYPALSTVQEDGDINLTKELIDDVQNFMDASTGAIKTLESERTKLEQFKLIKEAYERLIELRFEAENNKQIQGMLDETLDLVRGKRRDYIQKTLDAVADECDRLYEAIHPGESVGQVRFALKDTSQGSMELEGTFKGHDSVPPQAYFSESHLDTLGFCFFLALAKYSTDGKAIIVLDDVFTTVDLQHIERILKLIIDESSEFHQIIMTSHQLRWSNLINTRRVPVKNVQTLELQDWDIVQGIIAVEVDRGPERTQELLSAIPFDRDTVANSAGKLIESVCGEMTKFLELSIRRNPKDKYTASPLIDALKRKAKKIEICKKGDDGSDTFEAVIDPSLDILLDDLKKLLPDARNTVGSHYNWDEAEVPNADVRSFAEKAIDLAELFICSECKSIATKEKNGYLWCSCKKLRITKPD